MYYSAIKECDCVNGYGVRTTLWVSGCSIGCKGCFNQETHNKYFGQEFTQDTMEYIIQCLSKPYIQGITLSGGNPTECYNLPQIEKIIDIIKQKFNNKDIWIYSPYTWEEIWKNPELKRVILKCDVLVDGRYIEHKNHKNLMFRGSSNQRIIDIKHSTKNKIKELC